MPLLGLGTYKSTEKEAEKAIVTAAKYGYRLIDTASSYKNEDSIGRGIRASGIPRENFFITTKVWNTAQRVGDIEGAFNRSLDRLRLDYVDLYLIHWPVPGCYPETWRALEKIRESGRAKSIGVSNFEEPHLTALFEFSGIIPAVNQIECHPLYQDAIYQFRTDRSPKTRLFMFKAGTLVNFAMDLEEVYMTTKLAGDATFFLPFNMGNGEGVTAGAGNPAFEDKYSVSYMWEDILTKDTILDLISKFIFVETKEKVDDKTGKIKRSENLIFPRYHQLDVIRKVLADVRENRTAQNYLIQHSAGSGKTNSIAWLAHRLTSLHDEENKIIFDNIIIVTDRVVVDRQLQKAIMGMEHKAGLIRVMDDKCNSADLAIALNGNTKIIATTIQKFPYIVDSVKGLKNKSFAVIIDEAHSSTAGKDMAAVTMSLGSGDQTESDVEDMISSEIKRNGKRADIVTAAISLPAVEECASSIITAKLLFLRPFTLSTIYGNF